jgi:hypothetical protein
MGHDRTSPRHPQRPHLLARPEPGELAVIAALTLPFHNGRTEGVNTKTKMMTG